MRNGHWLHRDSKKNRLSCSPDWTRTNNRPIACLEWFYLVISVERHSGLQTTLPNRMSHEEAVGVEQTT